jgi:hypothetical protein
VLGKFSPIHNTNSTEKVFLSKNLVWSQNKMRNMQKIYTVASSFFPEFGSVSILYIPITKHHPDIFWEVLLYIDILKFLASFSIL